MLSVESDGRQLEHDVLSIASVIPIRDQVHWLTTKLGRQHVPEFLHPLKSIKVPLSSTIEQLVAVVESAPSTIDTVTAWAVSKVSKGRMCRNVRVCGRCWLHAVKRRRSIKRDTNQLECIVKLHSAPGNVDATRNAQSRQTLSQFQRSPNGAIN